MKLCEMAIYQTENPRVPSSILGLGTTDIRRLKRYALSAFLLSVKRRGRP